MKKLAFLILFTFPLFLLSQIPSYYNDVNLNLSGISLKNELATKIISTHTRNLSYSQVWTVSKITDLDPNNSANVILIYGYDDNDGNYITDRTRSKNANGGNGGTDWNREHTYAKSLGTPNLGTSGPGSDAHHLRPADVTFNGQRSSKKFATGSGTAGDSNSGWYPGDEWKGDIARMMMYMYLRYGNRCLPTGVGIGSSSSTPDDMITLFLQWNADDPVSQIEINRNNYHGNTSNSLAQGNRNPFIDNPAFATQIWGGPQAENLFGGGGSSDTQAPSVPTNLSSSGTTQTTTTLSWSPSTDNVGVTGYDVFKNGAFLSTTVSSTYNVTSLTASTSYSFTVKAKDAAGNNSASSSAITVTTQSGGGGGNANELFFSEYVEGSSYNKALEIANFTGTVINLSAYTIKKQSNGSGNWTSGLSLNGQLANGSVYVVANSNASTTILNVTDLTTSNSALSFNGNDPVGLFKNGILIDIIGTFNGGSANFGKDQTLRRKATVSSPNTTFDKTGEWDSFSSNTFDGLGTHTTSGGGGNQDTQAPSIPNSLTANTIAETSFSLTWNASSDNVGVTDYDIYKNGTYLATTASTSYNVTGLSASTSYSFTIVANDAAGNSSANSNALNVTTIDTTAPTTPSNLTASNTTQISTDLTWSASTDNVAVTSYDIFKDGTLLASTVTTSYSVTGLTTSTNYAFTVKANDAAGNTSVSSNTVNVTTQSSGGGGTGNDLFISEYVEGSSNNKAIEIVNLTGSSVNLSSYSLKRNTNGGTSWGTALNLSGQLADGNVFVIAHSSATTAILNVADMTSSTGAMSFNGNDPVGLFKNNVLIDIVGNFNGGSSNFAANTTLRRIQSVTNPNTTYTTSEWDIFASDTFDGLGTHSASGGGGSTSDILLDHSFETGWDGWTDGGVDCYRINSSRSFDGNYSIRIRDNSGTASAMTSSAYDVSTYDNLEITFNFYSYSMEYNEDFWLRYFDGSTWHTVQTFARGTDFNNNTFTATTVNISSANYNFPVNAKFRFQCDASSNSDAIYMDAITITGTSGLAAKNGFSIPKITFGNTFEFDDELIEIEDVSMYPNPSKNTTLLRAEFDIEDKPINVNIFITNVQGRVVEKLILKDVTNEFFEKNLDLTRLKNGLYFVSISTSNGFNSIRKLIVK
jgi:endonuclease I/chitodextrinase